jgi:uncharacterized protein YqhQ
LSTSYSNEDLFRNAWPLAAICCLGLLGFLIVAVIILALIPIYLPNTATTTSNNNGMKRFFFSSMKEYLSLLYF